VDLPLTQESHTGRTMGDFVIYGEAAVVAPEPPPARSLTTLVREERCAECPWPETCAADRTCWEAERTTAESDTADRRELQKTLGQIIDQAVEIRVRHELPEHSRQLLARLGATYVIAADAPRCERRCGRVECQAPDIEPKEETMEETEGRQALADMDTGPVVPCKIDGCENTTTTTHGRYARLCAEHRAEAVATGGGSAPATSQRASTTNGTGFTDQVKKLVPLAKADLEEAIRRVQGKPSPENLARLAETTKAMQKGHAPREKAQAELEEAKREFKAVLTSLVRRAAG
jgi:hypothetical protein